MADDSGAALGPAADALAAGDWVAARDLFRAALDAAETPEALAGLSEALWWLGETRESVAYRERAYAAFRRAGDVEQAAGHALSLSIHYRANVGNPAAASGWLARARTLVREAGLDAGFRSWIALFDAAESPDPTAAEEGTRAALALARRDGDADVELCALAQLGSCLVAQGRVDEGVALLDEAMAASLGGEGSSFDTVVFTSCNMVGSCTRCADFERAVQWINAADRFTRRYGCPFLYVYCRVHYGTVLIATGDWAAAEAQLDTALRDAEGSQPPLHAYARATLAALRLAQGRVEEAEQLVEGFDGLGPAAPVAAALHLVRGDPELAAATARRALDGADLLDRALLVELIGEAALASGDAAVAADAAAGLVADGAGCALVRARGRRLLGRARGARADLEAAAAEFESLGMPYEVARTRLLLAACVRAGEPALAVAEARAALTRFDELGAARDADAAAALLRELGVRAARTTPRGGTLTRRESEVLALLAEGLSNPEIAARLYLSRKTVEHHVAAILSKLGARNRAEAVRLAAQGAAQR